MTQPPAWRHDPLKSVVPYGLPTTDSPGWHAEPAVCGYRKLTRVIGGKDVPVPICATPVAVSGVGVIVSAYDGTIRFFSRDLAKQFWKQRLDGAIYASPIIDHRRRSIVVATATGSVASIELKGQMSWLVNVGHPVIGVPTVVPAHDLLVLVLFGSVCVGLDLGTGAERFRRRLPQPWSARHGGSAASRDPYASPVALQSGVVVVACAEHLMALGPDGSTQWQLEVGHALRASPVAVHDRGEVAVVGVDGRCRFVAAETGQILGEVSLGGKVTASPAVSGGILAIGVTGADAHGIDLATRSLKWTSRLQAPRDHTSFSTLPDGAFVSTNARGNIVALDPSDGRFRWETTQILGLAQHDPAVDTTPVVEPRGSMYSGSYSGDIYHHLFRPLDDQ